MIFSLQLCLIISLFIPAPPQEPREVAPASPPPSAPKSSPMSPATPAPTSAPPASGASRPRRISDGDNDKERHDLPSQPMSSASRPRQVANEDKEHHDLPSQPAFGVWKLKLPPISRSIPIPPSSPNSGPKASLASGAKSLPAPFSMPLPKSLAP